MRKYSFFFLAILFFTSALHARDETDGFVAFVDYDNFELGIEIGPAFTPDPIFKQQGRLNPATRVSYKQPRYIGGSISWRVNRYFRLQFGLNFTSADFDKALPSQSEEGFNRLLENVFLTNRQREQNLNSFIPSPGECEDGVNSIYCITLQSVVQEAEGFNRNDFLLGTQEYLDVFSTLCTDDCALDGARSAIETDETGREFLIRNMAFNQFLLDQAEFSMFNTQVQSFFPRFCDVDCQLEDALSLTSQSLNEDPITTAETYSQFLENDAGFVQERAQIDADLQGSKERCYDGCRDERARARVEETIRNEGRAALDARATDRNTFISAQPEYTSTETDEVCQSAIAGGEDQCRLIAAEIQILARGETRLQDAMDASDDAVNAFIETLPEYTAALNDACDEECARQTARTEIISGIAMDNSDAYDEYIRTRTEYTTAFDGTCNMDEECALQTARMDIFNVFIRGTDEYTAALAGKDCDGDEVCALAEAEAAIGIDEVERDALAAAIDIDDPDALMTSLFDLLIDGNNQSVVDTEQATAIAAGGTFLTLGGFISAYGDYPITNTFSIYGGGGVGLAWSSIRQGFIQRNIAFRLADVGDVDAVDAYITSVQNNVSGLGLDVEDDDFTRLRNSLTGLVNRNEVRRDVSYSTLSFAISSGVGFRTEITEGLILDTGYKFLWVPNLYEGSDESMIHQVKFNFVFKF